MSELDPEVEVEIDFSNIDRMQQHFDNPPEDGDFEVPVWHETTEDLPDLYSEESLTKGVELVRADKVKLADGRQDLYEVRGSELYACHVIDLEDSKVPGVTCTCPNGQNRSGRPTCYHSAAALLVHLKSDLDEFQGAL